MAINLNTIMNNITNMNNQELEDIIEHAKICPMCRLRLIAIVNCTINQLEENIK